MRETLLVVFGMCVGYGVGGLSQHAFMLALLRRLRGRGEEPPQAFTRSEAAQAPPRLPPGAAPGPRPVRGQRSSEGSHRATVKPARFGSRTFRRRR